MGNRTGTYHHWGAELSQLKGSRGVETGVNPSAVDIRYIKLVQGLRGIKHCLHCEETPPLKIERVLLRRRSENSSPEG